MNTKHLRGGLIIGLTALAASAMGVANYQGAPIYATGQNPPLDGYSPGSTASLQLKDDGLNGDVAADDLIWSRDVSIANGGTIREWKMAGLLFSPEFPQGGNVAYKTTTGTQKFIFDARQRNDGYLPDGNGAVGGTNRGVAYTVPAAAGGSDVLRATGSFGAAIGGTDWNASDTTATVMSDSATKGDAVAGDGIYTLQFTGVPVATYNFKVTVNGSFGLAIAAGGGWNTSGGNISFTTFATADVITILADAKTGRYKIVNSNPLANPGPPFYAVSSLWSSAKDNTTVLSDSGVNGDATAGDGIYSRRFTANATGTTAGLQVQQGQGPSYPGSGDYPFSCTSGQFVLVQFDTNTNADGFVPASRSVWVDPLARRALPGTRVVGNAPTDLGGSDWADGDTNFDLGDAGTAGDVTSGDKVFAKSFANPLPLTAKVWKGLSSAGGYNLQFGGASDGFTQGGNNDTSAIGPVPVGFNVIFVIDSVTGRIRGGAAGSFTAVTTRPASFNRAAIQSNVNEWSLY